MDLKEGLSLEDEYRTYRAQIYQAIDWLDYYPAQQARFAEHYTRNFRDQGSMAHFGQHHLPMLHGDSQGFADNRETLRVLIQGHRQALEATASQMPDYPETPVSKSLGDDSVPIEALVEEEDVQAIDQFTERLSLRQSEMPAGRVQALGQKAAENCLQAVCSAGKEMQRFLGAIWRHAAVTSAIALATVSPQITQAQDLEDFQQVYAQTQVIEAESDQAHVLYESERGQVQVDQRPSAQELQKIYGGLQGTEQTSAQETLGSKVVRTETKRSHYEQATLVHTTRSVQHRSPEPLLADSLHEARDGHSDDAATQPTSSDDLERGLPSPDEYPAHLQEQLADAGVETLTELYHQQFPHAAETGEQPSRTWVRMMLMSPEIGDHQGMITQEKEGDSLDEGLLGEDPDLGGESSQTRWAMGPR